MFAKCPKCKSVLEDPDFGIKVCGNAACGAMLFVDFEGSVQLSGEDAEPSAAYDFEGALHATNQQADQQPDQPLEPAESPDPAMDRSGHKGWMTENGSNEETLAQGAIPPPPADLVAQVAAEVEVDAADSTLNEADWDDAPLDSQFSTPADLNINTENSDTVDFSDVVDYGNSAQLDNNPLAYSMRIYGIDSRSIRNFVEEVLMDTRLNFHLADVMVGLKSGVLTIRNLSPVKASFIASKLRGEAVEFRWRQEIFGAESADPNSAAEGGAA